MEWNFKLFINPKMSLLPKSINTLKRKSRLFPCNCLVSRFPSILCTTLYNLDVIPVIRLRISCDALTKKRLPFRKYLVSTLIQGNSQNWKRTKTKKRENVHSRKRIILYVEEKRITPGRKWLLQKMWFVFILISQNGQIIHLIN